MASNDDDLDAFFDDVDKVAKEDPPEEDNQNDGPPPSKKQKTVENSTASRPPIRPRGVVVAAASSYKAAKRGDDDDDDDPYLQEIVAAAAAATTSSQNNNHNNNIGPPMPLEAIGPQFPPPGGSSSNGTTETSNNKTAAAASTKPQQHVRTAGGKTWIDHSLDDWPDNDFRIFVGNLAQDVTDVLLYEHFGKYASVQRAKVVRNHAGTGKKKNESMGYGFVSFGNALDCAKALREMDQSWLGSRPIRLKRSTWKDRELKQVRKNQRKHQQNQKKMGLL